MRPDFAEVPDVAAAEQTRIGVEDFFPSSASGGAQTVIVTDNRREVEYAQNHVAVVVFTYKAYDGVVRVVAPYPFEAGVVMVDFPERRVVLVDVIQFLHHGEKLAVALPADQVPVERLLFVPFAELAKFIAHEVELLARMRVLERVGEAEVSELLPIVTRHFAEHGTLAVDHFVVAENLYEVFRISIDHAERELVVMVFAVDRFVLDVAEEIVHPAHVPLVVEAEATLLWRTRDAWEAGGFFGDENRVRSQAAHDAVQVLQEFERVVVDVAAVFVRNPLAGALAVVEVEHRGDSIDAQTVAVEFLEPVHCVCDEKILDFVAAEVKDVSAPVRMLALTRIGMLVTSCAVETSESVCVLGEVCRNPVENHADFVLMAEIDKVAELVGRAVAARGGVVTRDLVAPGFVERMFCNRQKFYVRVAHFLEVRNEAFGEFVPVEEAVRVRWVATPGTGMDFVNVHRRAENLRCPVRFHIKVVAPFITVEVRRDGGCCRADFCKLCERVDFDVQVAVGTMNFKTVKFAFAEVRNEDFPNAARAEHAHLVAATVPAVEVAYDRNGIGVRCPDGEVNALESLVFDDVCAKFAVKFIMGASRNQVAVKF